MSRKPLLLLSALFLVLCITCLFYSDHSTNMLIALAVQLVFFIRFAIFQKPGMMSETQKDSVSEKSDKQKVEKFELDAPLSEIKNVQKAKSKII